MTIIFTAAGWVTLRQLFFYAQERIRKFVADGPAPADRSTFALSSTIAPDAACAPARRAGRKTFLSDCGTAVSPGKRMGLLSFCEKGTINVNGMPKSGANGCYSIKGGRLCYSQDGIERQRLRKTRRIWIWAAQEDIGGKSFPV